MEENKKQALSEIANMIFERRMETAKVMKAYISDTITNIEGLLSMSEIIGDVCSVKDDLKKGKLSVMAAQRNAHDYNFWVCFYPYGKNGELWSSPSVRHLIDTATPEDIFSDIKLLTLLYVGVEKSNEAYEALLDKYETDYEPEYEKEFDKQCDFIYRSLRENVIATIHGDIKAAKRHAYEINRLLRETNFSDSTYQIKIEPAKNENGQFYDMLMAEELDSKNLDNGGIDGQISFGEDDFYKKYEQKIKLLTEKFMPPKDEDEHLRMQKRKEMEQYADYRNYLSFSMYEQVTDENGHVIRENYVDDMAGRDSGGEGQNPKYVALLAGFAMLYMQQSNRDSKIKLVLLDEAFSKMDQERSAVCLKYARKMDLQLIVCVPDERLQSLIRNVDCVYGFRRHNNEISMMHIDKGDYLKLMEG